MLIHYIDIYPKLQVVTGKRPRNLHLTYTTIQGNINLELNRGKFFGVGCNSPLAVIRRLLLGCLP